MRVVAAVVGAAVVGAGTRWAVLDVLPAGQLVAWPLVAVNAAGCGLIGWAAARIQTEPRLAAVTLGFCGAFTSASSFAVEVADRLDGGDVAAAVTHVALTLVAAAVAFTAGRRLALR